MIFGTLVTDKDEYSCAQILVNSVRQFAGSYRNSEFVVYSSFSDTTNAIHDSSGKTRQIPLTGYPSNAPYFFASKVEAWAQAELMLENQTDTLIWIDPMCLVLQEPGEFALTREKIGAFRPVHIQNIGQPSQSPLDNFWQGIFDQCKTPNQTETVESFVDEKAILPYFNTHCFSINPQLGVLQRTLQNLKELAANSRFVKECLPDHLHKIFLFQAVLSATLLSGFGMSRIHLLTPDYGYPFHLQEKIQIQKRITDLSRISTLVYEDSVNLEKVFQQLKASEELRSWYENQKLI